MVDTFYTSGDAEIDVLRKAVIDGHPTTYDNFPRRISLITSWINLLQRQGADLIGYALIFDILTSSRKTQDYDTLFPTVTDAVVFLNAVQANITEFPAQAIRNESATDIESSQPPEDWALYGRDIHHTASTEQTGPQRGELAWKQAIGLAWYARAEVEDGRVYVSCPGIRNQASCYDLTTGDIIWQTRREWTWESLGIVNLPPSSYVTTGAASSPLILSDTIIINELGAQGRDFGQKSLVEIDKQTGQARQRIPSGEADYRIGYPPVTGNDEVLIYPTGTQRAQETPPLLIGQNRIICKARDTGETLWDFQVGATFCDPVLDDTRLYTGNAEGVFYCLQTAGVSGEQHFGFSDTQRVIWQFQAEGATNASPAVDESYVYFGSNDGMIHCLDKMTGDVIWQMQTQHLNPHSFRLFSKPELDSDYVYVGSATNHLYCLNKHTGNVIWTYEADDWIRSKPYVAGGKLFIATLSGNVHCVDKDGKRIWQKAVSSHPIYADITYENGYLVFNDSNLRLWCIDIVIGDTLWNRSILDEAVINGQAYQADELACGGWYQSKPTVADGKVFIGTPSRFVIAYDYQSGDEIWKFECGGAVSAAPIYDSGRIYFGQKGEEYFYCLDANTGDLIWKQTIGWVWSSANIADGKVYVGGSDGYVSCLSAETGHIIWRFRTGKSTAPEPPIDNGQVFFGSWDHFVYSLDVDTGKLNWQFHTGGSPDSGAPIAYDGKLYVPMGGNRLCCLDAEQGKLLWEYHLPEGDLNASPSLHNGRIYISLGIRSGAIPIASRIQCLNADTGEFIWEHAGGGITGSSVAGDYVYFASTSDSFFYCVDAKGNGDGTTSCLWRYEMGERVYESVPAIYDRHVYILSESGYLFAIR